MTTLKQARESGNFDKFIEERKDEKTDKDAFDKLLTGLETYTPPKKSET